MKKYTLILIAPLLLWIFLPIPLPSQGGVYNPVTGLIWCGSHDTCVHEVGHKLDDNSGWISHSPEFSEAVYLFVGSELIAHDTDSQSYKLANTILRLPGVISWRGRWLDSQSEIYATIFMYSGGARENMPEIFRPFYDWDDADRLLRKHQKYPCDQEEQWQ